MKYILIALLLCGITTAGEESKPAEVYPPIIDQRNFKPPPVLIYFWTYTHSHQTKRCIAKIVVKVNDKVYTFYPNHRLCLEWTT